MFLVGQRIHGRHAGVLGELLDIALRVRANDRAVNHPAEHARGVLDQLAAADLNVLRAQKQRLPAQFADADLERDARARGRLVENERPGLSGQRQARVTAPFAFHGGGGRQNLLHIHRGQFFK